jgi:hypothetical protein
MDSHLTLSEAHQICQLLLDDSNDSNQNMDEYLLHDPSAPVDDARSSDADVDMEALLADIEDSQIRVSLHQAAMEEQAHELRLLKASLEEDMRESVQHRERLIAMKDLYGMRDGIAELHEQRLCFQNKFVAAANMQESEKTDGIGHFDEGDLDVQFDAMLKQILDMRSTMEQLNIQKQLLERELARANCDILGR